MNALTRDQVFVSYSHHDEKWLHLLLDMLKPLVRNASIKVWADTNIRVGQPWREAIDRALASAKVAVLLVTHKFLASDFIVEHELPKLLDAQKEGVVIVWIAVSASLYMETSLNHLQAANDPSHPLDTLTEAEAVQELALIAEKIKRLFSR